MSFLYTLLRVAQVLSNQIIIVRQRSSLTRCFASFCVRHTNLFCMRMIVDAITCCSQGWEAVLAGKDYPEPRTEVIVAVTFQTYADNKYMVLSSGRCEDEITYRVPYPKKIGYHVSWYRSHQLYP